MTRRLGLRDYTAVTEATGTPVTHEALSMLYTRYKFAAEFCDGKSVLEVACGSGQGLGFLAARARRVVGADYTEDLLRMARAHYENRVPLVRVDAHKLPFKDQSFDVVILYEAIYYLSQPGDFLAECCRVLRPGGLLLVCTVNKEWSGFNPSPLSTRYFAAGELRELLESKGFHVKLYGAFVVTASSVRGRLIASVRRAAIALGLIPRTMKGKALLKRLFYGKLVSIPPELVEGMAELVPIIPIDAHVMNSRYKVIYVIGQLP